ncbi:uncharacterized protein J3D65DRAFT_615554 [Phyllosticta citribraziliensis]|uniref:Secreted protein n=1 Tax=Phyllosticta citribraziliensis TaxID=989973 RepID=A0ABR1LZA6_9PEZI
MKDMCVYIEILLCLASSPLPPSLSLTPTNLPAQKGQHTTHHASRGDEERVNHKKRSRRPATYSEMRVSYLCV